MILWHYREKLITPYHFRFGDYGGNRSLANLFFLNFRSRRIYRFGRFEYNRGQFAVYD